MKIKKNDIVKVISGEDRGKTGKVLRVLPGKGRVIVEGIAVSKKHLRQNPQEQQGGIVTKERPIEASNVELYCPKCNAGTRAGYKQTPQGERTRYCRKCGEML
jgi:large subunit ribosomal protein L24